MKKIVFVLLFYFVSQTFASETDSSIHNYRVQSQYGLQDPILNMLFPRNDKVELSLGGGVAPLSTLTRYYTGSASMVYHFNHRHAIEPIWYSYHKSYLKNFVTNEMVVKNSLNAAGVGVEVPQHTFMASYLFTPYYSKMHITHSSVTHFDVYFGAGFALAKSQELFVDNHIGTVHTRPELGLTAGMRFLFPPRFALRIELRDLIGTRKEFGINRTGNTLQANIFFSLFFGGFPERTGT